MDKKKTLSQHNSFVKKLYFFQSLKHMKSAETKINLCDVVAYFVIDKIKTETRSEYNLIKYLVQS